jgi:predicted AlkP superfamily phosphohydrolase/phosphomutase
LGMEIFGRKLMKAPGGAPAARGQILVLLACFSLLLACGGGRKDESAVAAVNPAGRVMVLGFDGLDPGRVRDMAARGRLPNFTTVMEQGIFTDLVTVLPPSSAPAWTSAITGVNPGKHGIFGFLKEPTSDDNVPIVFNTSRQRGFEAVWEVLDGYDRSSCIINIPLTSPADSLKGYMVAGFPHTSDDPAERYFPAELARRLADYSFEDIETPEGLNREEKFVMKMDATSSRLRAMGLLLLDERAWDLYWIVFTFTDRYQHFFWKYMDPEHPMYDPVQAETYGARIDEAYEKADAYLGEFMSRLGENDLLIIMSDHGFGHLYYTINARNFAYRTMGSADNVLCADFFGGIFKIEVSGRNADERYASLRDRLTQSLRELEDPERGVSMIDSIYLKDEIYSGPYLGNAPDVICMEKPGYLFSRLPRTSDLRILDRGPNPLWTHTGYHRRRGSLGLYGPGIRPGEKIEARITDIAPIVLAYLGVPVPDEVDGHVPEGAFTSETLERLQLARSGTSGYRRPAGLSPHDTKKIEKQLRAVGYIQ